VSADGRSVYVASVFDKAIARFEPEPEPPTLDASATKGKQSVGKLKIKVTADQDCTLDVAGKAEVAQRRSASKLKKFKLKKKTGIGLRAGVRKVIRLKFKNNRRSVRRITKLLGSSKGARKRSKVIVNLTATSTAGVASSSKLKIKLKP
jgi:hypothetical protein